MKKYLKSSVNDFFQEMKSEVEDYILNYYGELGYGKDECYWPECIITKQDSIDGKDVYKISIEFFALDTYDVPEICDELDTLTGYNGFPVRLYKNFTYDGEYTFTGYIIER